MGEGCLILEVVPDVRGWNDGRLANRDAMQAASERMGYKPSVIRLAGGA